MKCSLSQISDRTEPTLGAKMEAVKKCSERKTRSRVCVRWILRDTGGRL